MPSLLFYEKPVIVNRDAHKSTKIGSVDSYGFAANTNSVALTGIEFAEACKEYAVVFAKSGEKMLPVALLGMRDNENLFVDAEGKWDARYLPAFVRRYPFVLAETGAPDLAVCIDEASPAFNSEEGQPLFDADGKNTPFLENALGFLTQYQFHFKRTEAFTQRIQELELMTELSAKVELNDGRNYLLNGLWVVDESKLMNLAADKAEGLLKSGEMGWIYAHLISLSNVSKLVDKTAARP